MECNFESKESCYRYGEELECMVPGGVEGVEKSSSKVRFLNARSSLDFSLIPQAREAAKYHTYRAIDIGEFLDKY